jgi:hypothetical protein
MKNKFMLTSLITLVFFSKMSSQISINFNGSTQFCIGDQKIFSVTANSSNVCVIQLTNADVSTLGPNFNCPNGFICPFPAGSTSPNLSVPLNSAVTTILSAQPFDCSGNALSAPVTLTFTPKPPLVVLYLEAAYTGVGSRHIIAANPGFTSYAWTINGSPVSGNSSNILGITKMRTTPVRTFCVIGTDCNNNTVSDVCIDY